MKLSVVGVVACGVVLAALALSVLPVTLSEAARPSTGTALALLTLVGGALLMAVAAWSAAFHRR